MSGCTEFIKNNHEEIASRLSPFTADVYNTDSRDMNLNNNSVDLIVTSPPYPRVEMWEERFGEYDDMHDMIEGVLEECYRVLRKGGMACINMGDAVRSYGNFQLFPNHAELMVRGRDIGFETLVPILWKKPTNKPNSFLGSGFQPPNAYITLDVEYILIFRKEGPRTVEDSIIRQASQYTKEERDVWFSQIWEIQGETQEGYAVFPTEIPYRLIRMFSLLGDIVVDPFAGTGTTLEIGRALGRSVIGYEVNEELIPIINDKLDRVSRIQLDDILINLIRNEKRSDFPIEGFITNNSSLIDHL